ncbi:RNA polymerase sigma factor (sigma-70 family) [Thermocatellispora tengchongensis]|uniref:RNA polymerase sigma factor (Sigma-70 family) n=1 Tax=Thermocatellispora tengchongensis TaxID=1073253 RepID=A0A840PCU6_9ACTN|nr:sigma-70 family RNA polymerase sigma factor [Thermocatellispora tengchongensis]MBB5136526.1 RNA polymerase sigma factor (sigma-70 family) [Thermocatellispora tengchongensis]
MPGWPNAGRADDHKLAEALRRMDAHAPASLYDAYAERLHDYACSLLRDEQAAAEAVHDAIVTAHASAGRLGEAAKLRAWLYALVRFQCAARERGRVTPPHGAPVREEPRGVEEPPADPELTDLVHDVLTELSRDEREALELAARHGLTPAEVGAVLGITSRQAGTRLGRAREHLELAAAAVLLARNGRAHCPDLSAMLDSWEGPLTQILRRRLSGHIGGCEVCTELRHRQVSAEKLLDLVPVAYPPLSLRRRVIDTCVNPEREQTRTVIMQRTEQTDKSGFPVTVERRSRRRPRRLTPVVIAAVCLLTATGAVIVVSGQDEGPGRTGNAQAAPEDGVFSPGPDVTPEDTELPEEPTEPASSPTPSRTRTTEAPEAEVPSAAPPPRKRRNAPRPAATRGPAAHSTARFSASCPGSLGEGGAGRITLSARGAAVTWSASAGGGLSVQPSSGRLKAGATASVWVVTTADAAGTGTVTFTSSAGSPSCTVSWSGSDDDISEPPTDDPVTPTADPSETPTSSDTTVTEHTVPAT